MSLSRRLIFLVVVSACIACWPIASMAQQVPPPSFGAAVVFEYNYDAGSNASNRRGGTYGLDYFIINVKDQKTPGQVNDWNYGAEYRFLRDDLRWLHYGWAAYNFGPAKSCSLEVGYFQVPFGGNYDSWWCPLPYYVGFMDNQAMGVGYKYQAGPWRFDLDFFKNDTAMQTETYGANTSTAQAFDAENTGNINLAYTWNKGAPCNATFSGSFKGGQVFANSGNALPSGAFPIQNGVGTRWTGTLNMDANYGQWNLLLGLGYYEYSVPNSPNMKPEDKGTIEMQDFGFAEVIPAKATYVSASLQYTFKVKCLGPISSIAPYVDFSYLAIPSDVDYVGYSSPVQRLGHETFIIPGIKLNAGPLWIYIEGLIGQNVNGTASVGSDDEKWHTALFAVTALYF